MLISLAVLGTGFQRTLQERSLTSGQQITSKTTSECMNSSVLSTMENGYHGLKFMQMT